MLKPLIERKYWVGPLLVALVVSGIVLSNLATGLGEASRNRMLEASEFSSQAALPAGPAEARIGTSAPLAAAALPGAAAAQRGEGGYKYPAHNDDGLQCWLAGQEHRLAPEPLTSEISAPLLPVTPLWSDPELGLWVRMQAFMLMTGRQRYLDVGCGLGRIVRKFRWIFQSTTCLEPDRNRSMSAALLTKRELWFADKEVFFLNSKFMQQDFQPESFDAISSIHVVQHIPSGEVVEWFAKMRRLLKPTGVLIIATTHEPFETKYSFEGAPVSKRLFDQTAANPRGAVLPVHGFTKKELAELIRSVGLFILEHGEFQFYGGGGLAESQFVVAAKSGMSPMASSPPPPSPHLEQIYSSYFDQAFQVTTRDIKLGVDKRCG